MSNSLVLMNGVSKKFCRSLKRSLWYGLQDLGAELVGTRKEQTRLRREEFWALRDMSLEIKPGDSIGLIGRNGAGKTTLLRLLNGLIKPDQGRIEIRGRVQGLIALGAGFNPVLTGRENIYVNAAVLGITKKEVDKKFDEIVEFSGIESFIDTPVQSYSSGMTVRLGFSVAVHMEPDILLVDEVLAVGDIPFRAKCHKKLSEMKDRGIPWILVSHDMGTIRNLTSKAILLENGLVKSTGSPEEVISDYLYTIAEQNLVKYSHPITVQDVHINPIQDIKIFSVRLLDEQYIEKEEFKTGEPLIIEICYQARQRIDRPSFGVHFFGGDETCYSSASTATAGYLIDQVEGQGKAYFRIESLALLPGIYRVRADIWDRHMGMLDKRNDGAYLHVRGGKFSVGLFYTQGTWNVE